MNRSMIVPSILMPWTVENPRWPSSSNRSGVALKRGPLFRGQRRRARFPQPAELTRARWSEESRHHHCTIGHLQRFGLVQEPDSFLGEGRQKRLAKRLHVVFAQRSPDV